MAAAVIALKAELIPYISVGDSVNKLHEERDAIVVFKKWVMLSTVRKVQTKAKDMVDVGMDER